MSGNESTLRGLSKRRSSRSFRASSYDVSGGNQDSIMLKPGETHVAANIEGAGFISHIWMTCADKPKCNNTLFLRNLVLRMYWDGEDNPSVEVPLGDFFGLGHGRAVNFESAPFVMSPQNGMGLNCYFSMPFSKQARITVESQHHSDLRLFYYIDYELTDKLDKDHLRFHAAWHRENPCKGVDDSKMTNESWLFEGKNTTGENNYVILDAEGAGHYVGCHLDIHNLRETRNFNWYGEGDDMIFIDGESWPPGIHGTGTEDYFNTAWCPLQTQCTKYHGIIVHGGENWSGKVSLYRYHIEGPIIFNKSIRVTIEHGHNNQRSDDYSSTAYWYQTEPHKAFPELLPVEDRQPRPDIEPHDKNEMERIRG